MKKILTKLSAAIVVAAYLPACSSFQSPSKRSSKEIAQSKSYIAPKTYREHTLQQQAFPTKDGNYSFTDHGKGKDTIVMLHGVPTNSWMYRKVIPSLQINHRVISVDLLGYGSSAKPVKGNYNPANQAQNILALLEFLKAKNVTVMMHDMGGLVAWEMLRQKPHAVKNLIVLNTIATQKGFNHPDLEPGVMTKLITDAYAAPMSSSAILKMTFMHMGLTGAERLKSRECEGYVKPLKWGSNHALYAFYTSLNPSLYARLRSHQPTLRRFKGKTLVLWGAKDKNLTTKQIPYLQRALNIPASNINIYPNAGHLLAEEKPELIVSKINVFLQQ